MNPNAITPVRRRRAIQQEGSVTVAVERNKQPVHQVSHALPPVSVPVPHGEVGLGLGITHNLGNYESLRIDVFVLTPCGTSAAEYDQAKAKASALARRYMEEERAAALGTEGVTA